MKRKWNENCRSREKIEEIYKMREKEKLSSTLGSLKYPLDD
jgi:hypothetical protein